MNTIQSGNLQSKESMRFNEPVRGGVVAQTGESHSGLVDEAQATDKFNLIKLSDQDKEQLDEELQKHNKNFAFTGKYLKFRYDDEAETSYVEVINASTHEVIVSLPPEFLIDLSVKMKKILGMYIDEKL